MQKCSSVLRQGQCHYSSALLREDCDISVPLRQKKIITANLTQIYWEGGIQSGYPRQCGKRATLNSTGTVLHRVSQGQSFTGWRIFGMGIGRIPIRQLGKSSEIGQILCPRNGYILCPGVDWISILELVRGPVCFLGSGLKARMSFLWPLLPYIQEDQCRHLQPTEVSKLMMV